jgi:NAD(P)-dependent dehydrogenase (short-subunit alcohol dehydrogenase family)
MLDTGIGGSIVNIASIHGLVAAAPNCQAGYVASKAGVIGLTKELAAQWARQEIRVNAIAPGYFLTELTEQMLSSESGVAFVGRNTPMRRVGELHELDGAVLLLASAAGSYITGQTIAIDGGWTA